MDIFSGIFLEVQTCNRDRLNVPFDRVPRLISLGRHDLELAVCGKRPVILGDLITLRKVRVEVILAGKNRLVVYVKPESERRARAKFHRATIQHGNSARQTQTDRARVFISLVTESSRAATDDLSVSA